jgi:hypothetical protein
MRFGKSVLIIGGALALTCLPLSGSSASSGPPFVPAFMQWAKGVNTLGPKNPAPPGVL